MALKLDIKTVIQSNDTDTLRIVDGTGLFDSTTNPGGWLPEAEALPVTQPKVSIINGATYHLYLDLTITTSDKVEVTYDRIDLFNIFGPFSNINDLVFDIKPSMLVSGGVALGNEDTPFKDGWYSLTYSFVDDSSTYNNSAVTTIFVVDGVVRQQVYNKLRDIPYSNEWTLFNHDFKEWYDILYPLYYKGMLEGLLAEVSAARKNEILDMIRTLQRLLNQKTS